MMVALPRSEYPRPQFVRREWQNLNGVWHFAFDDDDRGRSERWFDPAARKHFPLSITVPFVYQSPLSGLGYREFHNVMWYRRTFRLPAAWRDRNVLLHIGAADYRAQVWVNGQLVAQHEGGHTPFQADITPFLADENHLVVRVEDVQTDRAQPRGKQYWKEQPEGIFYTGSSGIWQTVWLEPVDPVHLINVQFTPDLAEERVSIACKSSLRLKGRVVADISFDGAPVTSATVSLVEGRGRAVVDLPQAQPWSPEAPHLYDVTLRLFDEGQQHDEVRSYFGMRDIAVDDGQILLNGEPYTMKLVLDQGYYPQGLLTPPSDEALRRDVALVRAMGFNGVRKHQKVEDPRYLYWADRLGLLVWGEMANAYLFSQDAVSRLMSEWQAVVTRDYNHPCIVAWVPLNESWGAPGLRSDPRQAHFLQALYHQTRALDNTRLVMANDGWEHVLSDLCTVHDYEDDATILAARYGDLDEALAFCPSERLLYAPGFGHEGQPLFVSEFGGIAFRADDEVGWGYSKAHSAQEFAACYGRVVRAILEAPLVQGFCYTQFTDVEQEINGLLTYERRPKLPLETIRAINEGRGHEDAQDDAPQDAARVAGGREAGAVAA